jgi:transcriptional regulator with XRE-family HTH domain
MAARSVQNYLRTVRKESGLTQDEVGFLLGSPNGGIVSRYEQFNRLPSLETAYALEALFGMPGRELFAGTFDKAKRQLAKRAKILEKRLTTPDALTERKLRTLRSVGA